MQIRIRTLLLIVLVGATFASCTAKQPTDTKRGRTAESSSASFPPIDQTQIQTVPLLHEEEYRQFVARRTPGPVIPGIFQSAVPQGMAYYAKADLMFISCYMTDGRGSCVVSLSMKDGTLHNVFWIEEPNGSPHTGHVGGLAISKNHLWVASGSGVYYVDLDALDNPPRLRMTGFFRTAAKGSFSTFADGTLWIGEFTSRNGNYPTEDSHRFTTPSGELNHGWMAGFVLDTATDLISSDSVHDGVFFPDMIISIPHQVQGAAFVGDRIVLSRSYGRKNQSIIQVYANPLAETPANSFNSGNGSPIPLWFLDRSSVERTITAPPMSEGIVTMGNQVAVLFESGSDKYRNTARDPMDRIQILNIDQ